MLKLTKNLEEANLVTHGGTFHPDDVFSTVLMSRLVDNPVVYRIVAAPEPSYPGKIVYDVGSFTVRKGRDYLLLYLDRKECEHIGSYALGEYPEYLDLLLMRHFFQKSCDIGFIPFHKLLAKPCVLFVLNEL